MQPQLVLRGELEAIRETVNAGGQKNTAEKNKTMGTERHASLAKLLGTARFFIPATAVHVQVGHSRERP